MKPLTLFPDPAIDWAIQRFMELARIYAPSGRETQMAEAMCEYIGHIGIPFEGPVIDRSFTHFSQFDLDGECGNVIINIPASYGCKSWPCIGLNAHIDHVEPGKDSRGRDTEPIFNDDRSRLISAGDTILKADDLAGCCVILGVLKSLHDQKIAHGPIQIILTVSEEYRILGARFIDRSLLKADMIYSFDGFCPNEVMVGACSSDKYIIEIKGVSSHAGVEPEKGISAPLVFAVAQKRLNNTCLWGRITNDHGDHIASSNLVIKDFQRVGTNSVQAFLRIEGEARSFNRNLLRTMTGSLKRAFQFARNEITNSDGQRATVNIRIDRAYDSFKISRRAPIIKRINRAIRKLGLIPEFKTEIGGLDACWLNAHGIDTVALGTGSHCVHQTNEYLDLGEFHRACQLGVLLVSTPPI